MNDRLLASALLHALHSERGLRESASALARQADNHVEALDRALAHLLRRASERPTAVTSRADEMLRMARSLAAGLVGTAATGPGRTAVSP